MKENELNYLDDIRIDETCLDVEWLDQPTLMMKYCQYAILMRKKLDLAKEKVDIVKAELDKKIRLNPAEFGIEKLTETAVQNTIILQDEYRMAVEEMIEIKYQYDLATSAVRSIEQRRDALENLVKLHGQQYFAGPKVPRDIESEVRKRKEERHKDLNKGIGNMIRKK